MRFRKIQAGSLLAGFLALCGGQAARGEDVIAVLSSRSSYYQEAYEAFATAFARPVTARVAGAGPDVPGGTKVIVTFGAKAALQKYPPESLIVYCMAPGTRLIRGAHLRAPVRIEMLARAGFVLTMLKELQPGMKRLAIFWSSPAMEDYVRKMELASSAFGMEIIAQHVPGGDGLPERLRNLNKKKPDALWIPPDPELINPQTFAVFKDYSWFNDVPFYVPTDGLVEKGATASISCELSEIGRTAAGVARKALSNGSVGASSVFPEKIRLTISLTAAKNAGLEIPPEVVSLANKVLP